jgi:large subunit ribosomal protein L25
LGNSVRVRDINVGEDIEILNNPSIPIASVTIPRALKSAGSEEEGEEEGADGEEASVAETATE